MEASEELERGEITPLIFINRIAYRDNKIFSKNIDDFESVDAARAMNENDDLIDTDSEEEVATCSNSTLKLMPCLACLDKTSEIVMQPCGHMKICSDCWKIMLDAHDTKVANYYQNDLGEEYKPILKCPACNSPVNSYVNKVYA